MKQAFLKVSSLALTGAVTFAMIFANAAKTVANCSTYGLSSPGSSAQRELIIVNDIHDRSANVYCCILVVIFLYKAIHY